MTCFDHLFCTYFTIIYEPLFHASMLCENIVGPCLVDRVDGSTFRFPPHPIDNFGLIFIECGFLLHGLLNSFTLLISF